MTPSTVIVREVVREDWPILYEQQLDPTATEMAAFPARDWDAFAELRGRVEADPTAISRTIEIDGNVAGTIGTFVAGDERLVGYWLGLAYWGRGIATEALRAILQVDPSRPLRAHVVEHNVASIRVLEKCGFRNVATTREEDLDVLVMELDD